MNLNVNEQAFVGIVDDAEAIELLAIKNRNKVIPTKNWMTMHDREVHTNALIEFKGGLKGFTIGDFVSKLSKNSIHKWDIVGDYTDYNKLYNDSGRSGLKYGDGDAFRLITRIIRPMTLISCVYDSENLPSDTLKLKNSSIDDRIRISFQAAEAWASSLTKNKKLADNLTFGLYAIYLGETGGEGILWNSFSSFNDVFVSENGSVKPKSTAFGLGQWTNTNNLSYFHFAVNYLRLQDKNFLALNLNALYSISIMWNYAMVYGPLKTAVNKILKNPALFTADNGEAVARYILEKVQKVTPADVHSYKLGGKIIRGRATIKRLKL